MKEEPLVNKLLTWKDNNKIERILWVDEGNIFAFCIDISMDKGFPRKVKISDIKDEIKRGELKILQDDPFGKIVQDGELSAKEIIIRNKRWGVVQFVLSRISEPDIFLGKKRGPIIIEATKKYRISVPTVYKYLRQYWQRGRYPNALSPDYSNSRGKSKGIDKVGCPLRSASLAEILNDHRLKPDGLFSDIRPAERPDCAKSARI